MKTLKIGSLEVIYNDHKIIKIVPPLSSFSLSELDRILKMCNDKAFITASIIHDKDKILFKVLERIEWEKVRRVAYDFYNILSKMKLHSLNSEEDVEKFSKVLLKAFSKVKKRHRGFVLKMCNFYLEEIEKYADFLEDYANKLIEKGYEEAQRNLKMYKSDLAVEFALKDYLWYLDKAIEKLNMSVTLRETLEKLKIMSKGYVVVKVKIDDDMIINEPLHQIRKIKEKLDLGAQRW